MPKIRGYLDRVSLAQSYDEAELSRLELVYARACEAEGVKVGDPRRVVIASAIFALAKSFSDTGELLERVLKACNSADMEPSQGAGRSMPVDAPQ